MPKQDKSLAAAINKVLDQMVAENRGAIWTVMKIIELTGWEKKK